MKAEIITIGDEVLRGEIVDSNKALLAQRLLSLDIECHYQTSVRDDHHDMREAFLTAASRSDIVLVSGGLGPTRDDVTSEVIAETFGRKLELDEESLETIRIFFERVGREMADTNRKQAYFPSGAEVLANPVGTAPGFLLEAPAAIGEAPAAAGEAPAATGEAPAATGKAPAALFFCMPGVPRELSLMMNDQVLPRIEKRLKAKGEVRVVRARLLRTFGMGESSLEGELRHIARDGDAELAFRTSFPDNHLRVVARGASSAEADARIAKVADVIYERLGPLIYAEGDEPLEAVVGRLLGERGKTVATAESCTGGLIAQKLTEVPGSSAYFLGGVVAYANAAKRDQLGVPEALLEQHGAVSEPVARAMAEGARTRFGADIGVATTGISGPTGGTDEKPVGLVFVALACDQGTHVDHFVFPVDRSRHRVLTAQLGLDWVRRTLLDLELTGPSLLRRQGGASAPGRPRS